MTPALTDKLFVLLGTTALAAGGALLGQLAEGNFAAWQKMAGEAVVCAVAAAFFILRAKKPDLFTGWGWADKVGPASKP